VTGAAAAVVCDAVTVEYRTRSGTVPAVRDVSAAFDVGRLTVVAGPSGSGKSSLLGVVAGLHRPTAGRVLIDGADVARLSAARVRRLRRERIGVVLQRPGDNLVEALDALHQIELAARLRGTDRREAADLLATVGLADRAHHDPGQLSGGEQQRVAFAAAAAGGPAVLLADEPTAQLDAGAGRVLIDALRALVARGSTVVVTSHDPAVLDAADDVLRLRDGAVVA
jgi:ABC-type lipoprotein export system ATPase subunit